MKSVKKQVQGLVVAQVRNQVWDQVVSPGQVWRQVSDQVRRQVFDQVWRQVEGQVWDQVESWLKS